MLINNLEGGEGVFLKVVGLMGGLIEGVEVLGCWGKGLDDVIVIG